MSIFVFRGPSHWLISPGSLWARKTSATGKSNSRSKSMNGTPSGTVSLSGLLIVGPFHCRRRGGVGAEYGIEVAELRLSDQPVLVDPRGERFEPCGIQVDGPA